tara:strand:+ start:27201 stop:27926 length:726 start_codon:yes stop_codon:yes gene_type:complete
MASRSGAVASNAKVDLMAGGASVRLSYRLRSVVVFSPRHHVIARFHHLVALIAGIASVSRHHRVAASAVGRGAIRIGLVVLSKCLSMVCGALGGGHVRAWGNRVNAGASGCVTGLATTHAPVRWYAFLIVVTAHANLHVLALCLLPLAIGLGGGGMAGHATDSPATAIAVMTVVTKMQIACDELSLAPSLFARLMAAIAGCHGWASGQRCFRCMTACTCLVIGPWKVRARHIALHLSPIWH